MALTYNITPFLFSSSEDPHFVQVTSTLATNYGFKYKVEYLNESSAVLHTQYLAPNKQLANGVRFNVHEIMRDYVKPNTYLPANNSNLYSPENQLFRYKIKVTEEYLQQLNIIDHEWVPPYANENKTVIKTSQPHGYSVGDYVYIDITSVTSGDGPLVEQNIKNSLSGVKVVTNILDANRFVINVPYPGASSSTIGVCYYNDLRKTVGDSLETSITNILWSKNTYQELHNSTSPYWKNDYTGQQYRIGFGGPNQNEITISKYQMAYLNQLEYNLNRIRKVSFISDIGNTEYTYNCSNSSMYKLLCINPFISSVTPSNFDCDKYYTVRLLDSSDDVLHTLKVNLNNECAIFNSQLIFIDNKGAIMSLATELQQTKVITKNNEYHINNSSVNYWNNQYLESTKNTYQIEMTLNTNWLDYDTYVYSEQLFTSPNIWYKENENAYPQPCVIKSDTQESDSIHNSMYRRTYNITLI